MLRQRILQAAEVIAHGEIPRTKEAALSQYVSPRVCGLPASMDAVASVVPFGSLLTFCPMTINRLSLSPQCGFASHSRGFTFVTHEVRSLAGVLVRVPTNAKPWHCHSTILRTW